MAKKTKQPTYKPPTYEKADLVIQHCTFNNPAADIWNSDTAQTIAHAIQSNSEALLELCRSLNKSGEFHLLPPKDAR